jgi:hypothetical protein
MVVGIPSYDRPDIYTVLYPDGSLSEYSDQDSILELAPNTATSVSPSLLPSWVQDSANATLFLSTMIEPRHGKLRQDSSQNWIFCPGNLVDITQGIPLLDLPANFQTLSDTGQLFRGHCKFRCVYNARAQVQLRNCVLRHVSAHGLTSLVAPSSLKNHAKLNESDRSI